MNRPDDTKSEAAARVLLLNALLPLDTVARYRLLDFGRAIVVLDNLLPGIAESALRTVMDTALPARDAEGGEAKLSRRKK